jgi:actin-like ATPase involved in cell morphogenesis
MAIGMTRWVLSIDFGTSFTAASTREPGRDPQLLEISAPFGPQVRMPSLVLAHESGELLVGWPAESQAPLAPERVERTPKRRLGEAEPLLLGDRAVSVEDAVAAVLRAVLAEARRRQGGTEPAEVHMTHPARWARRRLDALRDAAHRAGIREPLLLSEPAAAAVHFSERLAPGDLVAVYDLGGGTFDTALLRRTDIGEFEQVGPPGGKDELGGEAFDERLMAFVESQLAARSPADGAKLREERRLRAQFRRDVRTAKEALSQASAVDVPLPPGLDVESVRVTREDFERLIRADVTESVEILARTLSDARIRPEELSGIFLAGGSTRIPLVPHLVEERLGRFDTYDEPKGVVALGASLYEIAPVRPRHDDSKKKRNEPETPKRPAERPPPPPRPQRPLESITRRGWMLAAGAIAIATVVGLVALVLRDGGLSGPFPTTKAERDLAQHLPDSISTSKCKRKSRSGALAAASCTAGEGLVGDFSLFESDDEMNDAFDEEVKKGEQGSAQDCPDREWYPWSNSRLDTQGRWACYLVDGRAHVAWTAEFLRSKKETFTLDVVAASGDDEAFGTLAGYFVRATEPD